MADENKGISDKSIKFECRIYGMDALRVMKIINASNYSMEEFTQYAITKLTEELYGKIKEQIKAGNSSFTVGVDE